MKILNSGAKRGNDGELKYYEMKGVKGTIAAKINQGMSSRVKTSAEYANTRLNNAEFGAAGNMAGAVCKALTQRWRSITVPFATAKLLPQIKSEMGKDTTNPWGQRSLVGTGWQHNLRQYINALSKVSFDEEMGLQVSCARGDEDEITVNITGNVAQAATLTSKGIDGVTFELHPVAITTPKYDNNLNGYTSAVIEELRHYESSEPIDDELEVTAIFSDASAYEDASGKIAGVIVVAKPYRTISDVNYVAQEYCCHKFVGFPASREITA